MSITSTKSNTQEFIIKARKIHGDKYEYFKVNYNGWNTPVIITCKIHGDFLYSPTYHLNKRGKGGCKECGQKIESHKSLAALHPHLVTEWHEKNQISPYDILPGCGKKFWWKCEKDHEWQSTPNKRTSNPPRGCPYCKNRKIDENNCLAHTHPHLIAEWHEKNQISPYDVFPGGNKKFWWKCEKNHEWQTTPNKRTSKPPRGCPHCNRKSMGESQIEAFLIENKIKYEREFKLSDCKNVFQLPFDFAIWLPKFCLIEYQGLQHYKNGFKMSCDEFEKIKIRDAIKNNYCLQKNIPLLKIPYWEYNNINSLLLSFVN